MPTFHPDLAAARFIPNLSVTPRVLRFMRTSRPAPAPPEDVRIEEVVVPGADGAPPTSARVYRPAQPPLGSPAMSALLWLHGGGFLLGSPEQDEASSIGFVRELGITVVAARYRLAPEHSAPAAVEDAYSSLKWLVANAGGLGVDAERVAIGGASAGAGLAAALSLYAHDRGEVRPAFQLLVYSRAPSTGSTRSSAGRTSPARSGSSRPTRCAGRSCTDAAVHRQGRTGPPGRASRAIPQAGGRGVSRGGRWR